MNRISNLYKTKVGFVNRQKEKEIAGDCLANNNSCHDNTVLTISSFISWFSHYQILITVNIVGGWNIILLINIDNEIRKKITSNKQICFYRSCFNNM